MWKRRVLNYVKNKSFFISKFERVEIRTIRTGVVWVLLALGVTGSVRFSV